MVREHVKSNYAFWAGAVALLVGIAYYAAFRWAGSVVFYAHDSNNVAFFPSFIHVFSFSLMTSACVWKNHIHIRLVCISWVFINIAFECAQLLPANPVWYGTFDFYDILASFAGGICAWVFVFLMKGKENEKH